MIYPVTTLLKGQKNDYLPNALPMLSQTPRKRVLDRLFMLQDTLHDFLETHPLVLENSGLQAYLSRAQDALASAYQLAGSIQPSDPKADKR